MRKRKFFKDKRLIAPMILTFLCFGAGIVLMILSMFNVKLMFIGLGVAIGGALIVSLVYVVIIIIKSSKHAENGNSYAEGEKERIQKVNESFVTDSRLALADEQIANLKKAAKSSGTRNTVIAVSAFFGAVAVVIIGVVLIINGYSVPGFVLVGIFVVGLISLIAGVFIGTAVKKSRRYDEKKHTIGEGVVLNCYAAVSKTVRVGGAVKTTRVLSVTYCVVVYYDGKKFNLYSKQPYNDGDLLKVAVDKKNRAVAIVQSPAPDSKAD